MKKMITAVAVLALGASVALAHPTGEGRKHRGHGGKAGMEMMHGKGGGMHMQRMAEKLGLTDAQKQQLEQSHQNFMEQNKAFFEAHRETRKNYREAKKAGDTARADSLKGTLDAQRTQLQQMHQAQMQQFLSVLTPEQRAKFDAMKAEREARRQNREQRKQK